MSLEPHPREAWIPHSELRISPKKSEDYKMMPELGGKTLESTIVSLSYGQCTQIPIKTEFQGQPVG